MHQLILLRHAKAAPAEDGLADHDRALTPEGRAAAAAMGAAMRRLGLAPDVVLVSTARRTQETLDALEPWEDRPNIEILPELYMASDLEIRDRLRDMPETVRSVLVIGHNPGIHHLARLLANGAAGSADAATGAAPAGFASLAQEYPTATLSEFLITSFWSKTGSRGAVPKRFLRPADLPPGSGFPP